MKSLYQLFGKSAPAGAVDVAEAKRRHEAGALLIDVREPVEWADGHAPGASLMPLGQLGARVAEIPRDREVLLICRSGSRSGTAQEILARQGYDKALNVTGGMSAWERAGLPVER